MPETMASGGAAGETSTAARESRGIFMLIREWIDPLVFAYLLAMFIRTFCVELFKIPSGSMTPTLIGDEVAEVDYDGDGNDDLIVAHRSPYGAHYQIFLRDAKGFVPGKTDIVDHLKYDVAQAFEQKKQLRYDHICVSKFAYWFKQPDRGDVVVFKVPRGIYSRDKPIYVKRLVGKPGETVAIRNNHLWIDGKPVTEPEFFQTQYYTNECDGSYFTERKLGPDEYLFFGDNTLSSSDGRKWGTVPGENLKGKAFLRYLPLKNIRFLP
jgi:signal peptidase I